MPGVCYNCSTTASAEARCDCSTFLAAMKQHNMSGDDWFPASKCTSDWFPAFEGTTNWISFQLCCSSSSAGLAIFQQSSPRRHGFRITGVELKVWKKEGCCEHTLEGISHGWSAITKQPISEPEIPRYLWGAAWNAWECMGMDGIGRTTTSARKRYGVQITGGFTMTWFVWDGCFI